MESNVDEEKKCLNIKYQTSSPLLAETMKTKNDKKVKEVHQLTVNFQPFKITHMINWKSSQIVYNAHDLLSIEPKGSKTLSSDDTIPKDLLDTRSFANNLTSANVLFNERPFWDLKEKISTGPQALSFDISIGNGESDEYSIFGLGERCEGKLSLDNTIQWEPYRLWTADHFDGGKPKCSTYGVSPII